MFNVPNDYYDLFWYQPFVLNPFHKVTPALLIQPCLQCWALWPLGLSLLLLFVFAELLLTQKNIIIIYYIFIFIYIFCTIDCTFYAHNNYVMLKLCTKIPSGANKVSYLILNYWEKNINIPWWVIWRGRPSGQPSQMTLLVCFVIVLNIGTYKNK